MTSAPKFEQRFLLLFFPAFASSRPCRIMTRRLIKKQPVHIFEGHTRRGIEVVVSGMAFLKNKPSGLFELLQGKKWRYKENEPNLIGFAVFPQFLLPLPLGKNLRFRQSGHFGNGGNIKLFLKHV